MQFHLILLLIISLYSVIFTSWNLNNYIRLSKASSKYSSDLLFLTACNFSKTYTSKGQYIAFIIFLISISLLIISSITIIFSIKSN
jgi:hypothetical protein